VRELALPAELRELVCAVSAVAPDEAAHWLTPEELHRARQFRLERRGEEWIAARVAVRRLAVGRGLITEPHDLAIVSSGRRPMGRLHGGERVELSLSHSAGWGIAAIDQTPVGVDLEKIRTIAPATAKFFLHEDEREMLEGSGSEGVLLTAWAAKEAAFKAAGGLTLLKEVRLEEIEELEGSTRLRFDSASGRGTIVCHRLAEFMIALARMGGS
jgi:phosphopantetheinyl transferase